MLKEIEHVKVDYDKQRYAGHPQPGKIFAAYYFMEDDGNNFGGTRFIAGTHFRL